MIDKMLELIMQSDALTKTKQLAEHYKDIAEGLIEDLRTPYSKINFRKLVMFIISR